MAVETRLLFFSKEVTRCIKDPTVVSHLEADSIISSDESSRLKKLYLDGDPFKANEEMINCLQKSTARGKWRSFLDALEKSDYLYLKSLLESTGRPDSSDKREKEIIKVFIPFLEKTVVAMDIVTQLYSRKVINDVDLELIRATYQNKGDTYATIVLLERMQCRLAPDEWYYEFLCVLVKKDLKHVVGELEPDFLHCPEQFRPGAGSSGAKSTQCDSTDSNMETYDNKCGEYECSASGNVIEHVVADYGDAEEDMDLGVPVSTENDDDPEKEEALDLAVDTSLKDACNKSPHQIGATTNLDKHDKFCVEETEKNAQSSRQVLKLGERAPPEGHDFDGDSSCDGGAELTRTKNEPKISKALIKEKGEREEKEENIPTIDKTKLVSNELASDTEKSDDSCDDITDYETPLAQILYPFQLELAEKALAGKNTIICAPTGSGKTWVASHIIDRHLQSSANGEKKKVVFMARNGVLVSQQMDFISKRLPYARVKHLKGDTEEAMMMHAFLEDYDIFLFTPQILVNNLSTDVKSLSVFSLMVFDECHHTKGAEPYNRLMQNYLVEKSNGTKNLPQIIGLTASIGTGRAKSEKDALDHIFRVCASLDVRCLSTVEKNRDDLAKHVSVPSEENIPMKMRSSDETRSIILEAIKNTGDCLEDIAFLEPKLIQIMHKCPSDVESKRYELWTAEVIKIAESLTRGQGRDIASCAKYLQVYYNALEINRLLRTTDVAVYLAKQHAHEAQHQDSLTKEENNLLKKLTEVQKELRKVKTENPNVHVISKILSNLFAGKDADANSRAMVFVHARATCRSLADFLNDELEGIYVKTSPFLGKDTRGTDKGMTEDEQTRILEEFRDGTYKILVATSVGMEGLDVPDCNMTLNYNFTGDEITKIQMSGRSSRKQESKAVMIATDAQFQKDKIAIYRIKLMTGAVEEFKKLDHSSINRQILSIQKKMLDDYKWQLKTKELKRSKQSDEIDYEIQCRKCSAIVCNASDVRRLDTSFLVALRGFGEKISKEKHTKRANMGALKKKYKMFCKTCPNDWGVIAVKDDIEYYVLKLESLKFVSSIDKEDMTNYKKWSDVPYKIEELGIMDLSHMYDETN